MAKERQVKCDCGYVYEPKEVLIEGRFFEAMVCPNCGDKNFTSKQVRIVMDTLHAHEKIDTKKKIIQVGNSLALLLPRAIRELGVKVGTLVKIEAKDKKTFIVKIL